jgi:arginase
MSWQAAMIYLAVSGDMMDKPIAVIDAPSNLGLRPLRPGHILGANKLAAALRAQDILIQLNAHDAGRIPPLPYSPDKEPVTGFKNGAAIPVFSEALAEKVKTTIEAGYFPLVLGGDCSILLGNMLALRQIGRYGLFFLDGHHDYCYPKPTAAMTPREAAGFTAAGLDLALVTGHGPAQLTNLRGLKPYVREEDAVAFGFDVSGDAGDEYDLDSFLRSDIHRYGLAEARRLGVRTAAEQALAKLQAQPIDGFWIHLDADVLHPAIMPAVDSPNEDGLSYEELIEVLQLLLSSGSAVGMEVTIFDPDLDPDGRIAQAFTAALVRSFLGASA